MQKSAVNATARFFYVFLMVLNGLIIFFSAKVHQFVSELIYLSVFTAKIRSMFTDWIIKLDLFLDDELGLIHL